jgi:hypothetical protein
MKTDQQTWIDQFVNQTGAFQDPANLEFVDKKDLQSMKFYLDAAQEIFDQAKEASSQSEYRRLMAVTHAHLARVSQLLARYGQDTDYQAQAKSVDQCVEHLLRLVDH